MAVKAALYNQKGEKKGDIALNSTLFESSINEGLMHQAVLMQLANARSSIAHTKTRAEVRGGGRKPHRQKGTGQARTGSSRGPIHRGGGIVFGPRNTRNFEISMPKKQRRKALFSALSGKASAGAILVLEAYTGEVKTKPFAEMIQKLPVERNVLVVIGEKDQAIQKSSHNLPNVKTILANYLNVKDILHYHSVLFLKDALKAAEYIFLEEKTGPKKTSAPKLPTKKSSSKKAEQ